MQRDGISMHVVNFERSDCLPALSECTTVMRMRWQDSTAYSDSMPLPLDRASLPFSALYTHKTMLSKLSSELLILTQMVTLAMAMEVLPRWRADSTSVTNFAA